MIGLLRHLLSWPSVFTEDDFWEWTELVLNITGSGRVMQDQSYNTPIKAKFPMFSTFQLCVSSSKDLFYYHCPSRDILLSI